MSEPLPRVTLVGSLHDWLGAVSVRIAVFVDEQRVPFAVELDHVDPLALHAVALVRGPGVSHAGARHGARDRVVGTARIFPDPPGQRRHYRFGRLAVLRPWRRRGLGDRLLTLLEDTARKRGGARVTLHAQTYVESFYARHGYVTEAPRREFFEDGIPHVRMTRLLTPGHTHGR
ncbi:MAG TPA: GNAT family N-acetyltransferase [Chloroflexota bacterium]|nr:GNAT family N-acetyltransferase [Chloroflexota bacterium]